MAKRRGRGEGSIEELDSGSYRVVLSDGFREVLKDPSNPNSGTLKVRKKLAKTFRTKAEALDWKREKENERATGVLNSTSETLGEWLTTWLQIRKPVVSANTYRTERDTAERRVRPGLGEYRLRDLTAISIERWFAKLAADGVSQNERHKCGKLLRTLLNDATRRRVLGVSPMRGVTIPQPPDTEAAALDKGQLVALLKAAKAEGHEALFRLWADAGLRPGELYALTVADFDQAAGTVTVRGALCQTTGEVKATKTKGSRRTLLLAPSTVAAVRAWLVGRATSPGPLFPAPEGGHWWRKSFVTAIFNPVAERAGLAAVLMPYTLRHTMASLLLQAGVSLKVVSERLGHTDVTTTLKVYCHLLPGMQQQAVQTLESILNPSGR